MKPILLNLAFCLSLSLVPQGYALDARSLIKSGLVAPETLLQHEADLALTEKQSVAIRSIGEKAKQLGAPMEQEIRNQQLALEVLLKAHGSELEQASVQLTRLLEAEAALKQLQLRTLLELRNELKSEQVTKALALSSLEAGQKNPLEGQVKAKVEKLQAAVQSLGSGKPPQALSDAGAKIQKLIQARDWTAANKALDTLSAEIGADESSTVEPVDYNQFPAGNTEVETLKQRYEVVRESAQKVTRLSTIRQFLEAAKDLNAAIAAEDTNRVGKILTWAEGALASK